MSLMQTLIRTLGLNRRQIKVTPRNVVLITGCDSGLGHSFAVYCHSLNMTVVSACHNVNSEGAQLLRQLSEPNRMHIIELDVLCPETIKRTRNRLMMLLENNDNYQLTALINNAGVMCFGEFEWQTYEQIAMQINVNLIGTMSLTKELLPLLRKYKGRIINVTSHCALQALPALSPYAASKAALRFWNDALRIEMKQYEVKVVNFIPGSFVLSSNISARQQEHAKAMYDLFSDEQRHFYSSYFNNFNKYLKIISGFKKPNCVNDEILLLKLKDALTNTEPKSMYIHETWRYKFYRLLFCICPTAIVDWFAVKFCGMPTYHTFAKK